MKISIIIPTYNEETTIEKLVAYLHYYKPKTEFEIIIIDGGSTDRTIELATKSNQIVEIVKQKGRASQMNYGAQIATGDILYFVHADTFPPKSFGQCIINAIDKGYTCGCCAYKFDSNKIALKLNSFLTQFNGMLTGGGDQTLFITKKEFIKQGGFNPKFIIMEDFELTRRLKKTSAFVLLKSKALVSARKFEKHSYLRVNIAYTIAMFMFKVNMNPQKISKVYKRLIY